MERPSYRIGIQFSVLSYCALMVLGLLSSVVIARLYGIGIIGENALSLAPILVLAYLSTVREQAGLVRELVVLPPRAPQIAALFYVVLTFSVALTLLAATVVIVGAWFVFDGPVGRPDLFLPALVQTAGFVLFTNSSWNVDMVLSAFRAGRELFWVRLMQAMSFLLIAISLGLVWRSVWALVTAMVGSLLTGFLHRLVLLSRFMTATAPRADLRAALYKLPGIIRYGMRIAPGIAADGLSRAGPTLIIGAVMPLTAVGAYSRAATLGDRVGDVNVKVGEMLFPTLVERRAGTDQEGFGRALVDTMRYLCVGVALVASAGGGAARGVMDIFGAGFSEGAVALTLLLGCAAVASFAGCVTLALYAIERLVITTIIAVVRLVTVIPFCIVMTLEFGVTGAALALVVTQIGQLASLYLVARPSIGGALRKYWPLRERLALAASYGIGLVGAGVVDAAVSGFSGTIAALLTGATSFALTFQALRGVNARDYERIRSAREGWRARRAGVSVASAAPGPPEVPRL